MKFGFKGLKDSVTYTIVDVIFVRRQNSLYEFKVVLHYNDGIEDFFVHRYSNVQFGRQLRINSSWKKDSVCKPKNTFVVDLPGWLCRSNAERIKTDELMSEDFLFKGRFNYIEGNETHSYGQKAIKFTPKYPYIIGNMKVEFFIVPNYEFYRYFVFGFGVYNEKLLNGMSFENNSSNQIYNPDISGIYEDLEQGVLMKIIQLRSKIVDTNAPIAGDLLFNKKIKEMAGFFVTGLNFCRYPFPCKGFPVNDVNNIKAYGNFVESKDGKKGFYISSFAEIDLDHKYYFRRDNDGRTTSSRDNQMPKIFKGKRRKKVRKKSVEDIKHDVAGDKDIEPASLNESFDSFEFQDRSFEAIKLTKTTQENIADITKQGGEVDPIGKGVASDNAGKGSGYQSVDNSLPIGENYITEDKYWKMFPEIIFHLSNNLSDLTHKVEFFSSNLEFTENPTSSNLKYLLELKQNLEFYLIRIQIGNNTFYVIEIDPRIYEVPTMVFWNEEAASIFTTRQLSNFLKFYYSLSGVPKNIAKAVSKEYQPIEYKRVVHNYLKKTGNNERYSVKESIEKHGEKIAKIIRGNFV